LEIFDIVIIGAGPAGATAAWHLLGNGLRIALVDKSTFPRDKICGDALSGNTLYELKKLEEKGLDLSFMQIKDLAFPVEGLSFFSPKGYRLDLFRDTDESDVHPKLKYPGFVSKRIDFDNFLIAPLIKHPDCTVIENCEVKQFDFTGEKVEISCGDRKIAASMVIAADGANSILARESWRKKIDRNHYSAGLRQYYSNVNFEGSRPLIELHFLPEILPGYFWIFPLPDNKANIGIGMLASALQKREINLKDELSKIIQHPKFSSRFQHAEALEPPKGFGLPLGSRKSKVSGDRYLLIGDAASLIDPFTGEGIGYAMCSGRLAAEYLLTNWGKSNLSSNKHFDDLLWQKIGDEIQTAYSIQKLLRYPWLFDCIAKAAIASKYLHQVLNQMVWFPSKRKRLLKPWL
jgi:menaquinone-9 beta-reductase